MYSTAEDEEELYSIMNWYSGEELEDTHIRANRDNFLNTTRSVKGKLSTLLVMIGILDISIKIEDDINCDLLHAITYAYRKNKKFNTGGNKTS